MSSVWAISSRSALSLENSPASCLQERSDFDQVVQFRVVRVVGSRWIAPCRVEHGQEASAVALKLLCVDAVALCHRLKRLRLIHCHLLQAELMEHGMRRYILRSGDIMPQSSEPME